MYSINSIGTSSDIDLKDFKQVLLKNQYPLHMIDNVIKKFFQNAIKTNTENVSGETPNIKTRHFKLPFISIYSKVTQNKIEKLCKIFCKNAKVKLSFTSNKFCETFTYKDSYPSVPSSKVAYKLAWASCNAGYVVQAHQHPITRNNEHFGKNVFILDTARRKNQLRITESLFIIWLKPTLNRQSYQYIISLPIWPLLFLFCFPLLHFVSLS